MFVTIKALCLVYDGLKCSPPLQTTTIALFVLTLLRSTAAQASTYSDLLTITRPGHLSLTISSSGYGSDSYDTTYEGFELEQSATRFLGLIARVSAYQIYHGDGFNTPFPFGATDRFARGTPRNFGR